MDPKQRMIRRDFDLVFDGVGLKAYTKTIDDKEVKFLGGTASSTVQDLYGDIIGPEGQVKMLAKLTALAEQMKGENSGLTGWLNHSYKIPEDTLGAFTGAALTTRAGDGIADEKGVEYIDLDIELRVTETNPRAIAAWEQVKDGMRHGWSIGAIFTDAEWLSDDPDSPDYWSLYVTDINLLEISLVGIPANQRAWCKSQDDLKARAVKIAEDIVREAHAVKMIANVVNKGTVPPRDPVAQRGMVLKSLVHLDGEVADTTSTSPITGTRTAEATQLELVTNGEENVTPESSVTTEQPKGTEPEAELSVEERLATALSEIASKSADELRAIGREASITTLKELQAKVGDADGNATRLALQVAINALEAPIVEVDPRSLVLTVPEDIDVAAFAEEWKTALASAPVSFVRLTGAEGEVANIVIARGTDATDMKAIAKLMLGATEDQITELSAQLVERAESGNAVFGDDAKMLLLQAAGSLDVLSAALKAYEGLAKLEADGDGPDGAKIAQMVGHVASAVGHGVCVRSAKHLAEALKCLSAAVGNDVPQPGPEGDVSTDESLSAQLAKLEPKAGDVIVVRCNFQNVIAADLLKQVRELVPEGVNVCLLDESLALSIDNDLAAKAQELDAKQQELTTAETSLTEKQSQLTDLEQKTTEAQTHFDELQARIADAAETRLGRKSVGIDFESRLADKSNSEVKPEHYQVNATAQREKLANTMSGDAKATTGRDIAATL